MLHKEQKSNWLQKSILSFQLFTTTWSAKFNVVPFKAFAKLKLLTVGLHNCTTLAKEKFQDSVAFF